MIGNVSGGQGADDLAVMLLRMAADPKKTEARLKELRAAEASVEAQRHELMKLRDQLDGEAKAVAERERAVTTRELSVLGTETRQNERAAELQKQGIVNRDRTVALNEQELKINTDAHAMMVREEKVAKEKKELDSLRAELNALKKHYEGKLAALREIVK